MASVAPPNTRDIYLVCVESNPATDSCDAYVSTHCIDSASDEPIIHTELLFTIPCLGTQERCLTHSLPHNMPSEPAHGMPRMHLASFRVVRSTLWSALPPFLSWLLALILTPFFALFSLLTCRSCFPCTREKMKSGATECYFGGVSEEDRRQFGGGVQVSVDRQFRAEDRFRFYQLTGVSELQRERMFTFLLAQAPDAPLTDDYKCCTPGYNYKLWACLPIRACFQRCCPNGCCAPGAHEEDFVWTGDSEAPQTEEAELNQVAQESDQAPLVGVVQKMRSKYPRRNWLCSEMVAAALIVGGVLKGLEPRCATPSVLYAALKKAGKLQAVLIENVKGGERRRELPPLPPRQVAPMEVEGAGLGPKAKKAKKGAAKTMEEEADELLE